MPGLPLKVGNSGDMVWVRSTTFVKLRGAAMATLPDTAVATNPAALARAKNPRRVIASRTARSHPATHIASPLAPPRPGRSRRLAHCDGSIALLATRRDRDTKYRLQP